jgi:CRISPR-associated endonuclease Cas2
MGFLHSHRYGRRSLPLDLIEEFRHPVVDGLVQYGVFECRIDMKTLQMLVKMLEPFPECGDSIRIYLICEGCLKKAILLGRGEFLKEEAFHIV